MYWVLRKIICVQYILFINQISAFKHLIKGTGKVTGI